MDYYQLFDIERDLSMLMSPEKIGEMIDEATMPFKELMAYYKCAMMQVETKFNVLNENFSLGHDCNPIAHIKTRLKSPRSILEKMSRYGVPMTTQGIEEGIQDIAGVRVVCNYLSDIYELADALLRQDDVTLVERKDYIRNPKPNGYRSLHLIISTPIFLHDKKRMMKVEVQLRTLAMDTWASQEHQIRYKKDSGATEDEVKTAYRKLAMRHHPDRVASQGQDAQKKAEMEFRKINEAYESIKKYRGFS